MQRILRFLLLAILGAFAATALAQTEVHKQPPSLTPSQVLKAADTYLDKTVRVRGYPTIAADAKPDPDTGIWKAKSDGVQVELTKEAKEYLDKQKPTGITPNFSAVLRKRDTGYVLVYEKGLPVTRP